MTEWDELDLMMDEDAEESKRRAALWQALEDDHVMPEADLLGLLSSLLDDDILRIRTLWTELEENVRLTLTTALVELSEADFTQDFSAIFRLALHDNHAAVRVTALKGLDEVEDVRLVPELVRMLRQDPSIDAQRAAAEGLGKFVLLGELQKLRPDPFHRTVLALRDTHQDHDQDLSVRKLALESLAYTGDHGVPEIIEAAYAGNDEDLRRSAVVAMGRSADARWGEIVLRELVNPSRDMRYAATRACGELQLRKSVRELIELTDDVDERIQATALWALGQIGGSQAKKTLQRFAEDIDHTLAHAADEALQELEFFHGDLPAFFGPPESFDGETDGAWQFPDLMDLDDDEDEGVARGHSAESQVSADDGNAADDDEDDLDLWDDEEEDYDDDLDIYDIVDEDDEDEWD